jgi:hypothetical protein
MGVYRPAPKEHNDHEIDIRYCKAEPERKLSREAKVCSGRPTSESELF